MSPCSSMRGREKTVLSEELSSSALAAEHADIRQELNLDIMMMTMTIVSAQLPTLCGHPPVTNTDSESDGDSSDSVFYTRPTSSPLGPSSSLLATSSPLGPSSSLLASSSPLGPSSSLFGSSMTSTEMNKDKAVDANQVKDQNEEDKKASENNKELQVASEADFGEDQDGANQDDKKVSDLDSTDANSKDVLDDGKKVSDLKSTDANSEDVIDDGKKASEANSRDVIDDGSKAEKDDQDWGNWQSSWQQKKYDQGLSHGGKKKLNKEMRDLVRPVHVGSLAYVLPDKAKKCCLTWRAAVDLHLGATGKRPTWSSHFIECKICHRFSTSEREFEEHYAARHVDLQIYNQTLRRLKQWNTADVPETEVEYNINLRLIYSIGQALDIQDKTIENDILQASGLGDAQKLQQKPIRAGSGSTNRPRDPAVSVAASTMAPETPTTPAAMTPRLSSLLEKGRAKMGAIQKPVDKADSKPVQDVTKDNKKTKRADGDASVNRRRLQLST